MLRYLLLFLLIGNCVDIAFCGRNCSEHKSCNACAESECVWCITINECHNSKIACPASNGVHNPDGCVCLEHFTCPTCLKEPAVECVWCVTSGTCEPIDASDCDYYACMSTTDSDDNIRRDPDYIYWLASSLTVSLLVLIVILVYARKKQRQQQQAWASQ